MTDVREPDDKSDAARFDSQKLAQLGRAVIGERSIQEFCKETSLSRSLVSRLLNGSLKAPPTIRSIYRFAGSDSQIAYDMLNACGYPTDAIEHLSKMPDLLRKASKSSSTPASPQLFQNHSSGLSLFLKVLSDHQYGEQFDIAYHIDGTFAINSVEGHTLVGIPALCSSEGEVEAVWKRSLRAFALALTRWDSPNTCYMLFTNVKQIYDKLTNITNLCYKLAVLLTTDGQNFQSQHVIPPYGGLREIQDECMMDFPINLVNIEK